MDINNAFDRLSMYLKEYQNDFYEADFSKHSDQWNLAIFKELITRLKRFEEFTELTKCFYQKDIALRLELLVNEKMKIATLSDAKKALELAVDFFEMHEEFETLENLKQAYLPKIPEAGMKNGQALWPVRVVLTGEEFSPGAFEVAFIL